MTMQRRKELWDANALQIEAIVEVGIAQYVANIPNFSRVFNLEDLILRCMDGRTPGGVHLAGSGILLGLEGSLRFAEEVKRLRSRTLEAIAWHADCGAAAAYAAENGGATDEEAHKFAKLYGSEMGVPIVEVKNTHKAGFHPECVVYYDGTGVFDWTRCKGLPCGFTISRAYLGFDADYALREVEIACGIALKPHDEGGHGFGELFTCECPLLVVAVAESRKQLDKLQDELRPVVELYGEGKVHLDGFVRS